MDSWTTQCQLNTSTTLTSKPAHYRDFNFRHSHGGTCCGSAIHRGLSRFALLKQHRRPPVLGPPSDRPVGRGYTRGCVGSVGVLVATQLYVFLNNQTGGINCQSQDCSAC
jgi:hypothetical protein